MPSRRDDLEGAAAALLASDLSQIGLGAVRRGNDGLGRLRPEAAPEERARLGEVPERDRLDARERGLRRRLARTP